MIPTLRSSPSIVSTTQTIVSVPLTSKMNRNPIWVVSILFFLTHRTKSDEGESRDSLIEFYRRLSSSSSPPDPVSGWNSSSYPCKDQWRGVTCDNRTLSVKKIQLDGMNFTGTFDASTLCDVRSVATSLTTISLNDNSLTGEHLDEISKCTQLTNLHMGRNRFSGSLPDSLSRLNNLKGLDISRNSFSGRLPDLALISGLQEFLAQNNQLSGDIPSFNFPNFLQFNVSFNNFTGSIPFGGGDLPASSFMGNPELCGDPLPKKCPSQPPELPPEPDQPKKSKGDSDFEVIMFSGYILIGLALFLTIILKLCKRDQKKEETKECSANKVASVDDSLYSPSKASGKYKASLSKPEISAASAQSVEMASSSLIVLASPEVNGLKFEDLLKAPAELLGRGKHGTVYKVLCDQGFTLAVKRIRDWPISPHDFKRRMRRLDQVKHPNVLPAVAFYCSQQEKLLVYEYQENGSLFELLHGSQNRGAFDWSSRLGISATVADALAFMHQSLGADGIAHGNLKSSNILLNKNMEPRISEYGLVTVDNEFQPSAAGFNSQSDDPSSGFRADIYSLGVILLELLTGKMEVQNNGMGLARWVLSVVREEWTVEVFDKGLIQEGASEERLMNLLLVALKCVSSPETRPSINQVALMLNTLKEEDERSIVSET
ncbi:probable inactive receptor kinase At2g26730 [Diospyros lotus]|uniref:probable inactive receptor kinase At2g26730 n=1 Tax=Diospyros lotus TaxID=55363 RepID=UPI0022571B50|nr:probable inactive receptor kinase At2g26730 [Diospyros lotus]